MSKGIIHANPAIHPLENGKYNAKYYPYWDKVVNRLPEIEWKQIGVQGNFIINNVKPLFNLPLKEVYDLCVSSDIVCCIDSFLPHLLAPAKKKIIVIYTLSDPKIFGYEHNVNLYKKEFLRPNQFDIWRNQVWDKNSCIDPEEIIKNIKLILADNIL